VINTKVVQLIMIYNFDVDHFFIWVNLNLSNLIFFKNNEFEQKFETQNDFNIKSHEYQSFSTHQYLQLLFRPYCHLTKFKPLKFEISQKQRVRTKIWDAKWLQHEKWWIPKLLNSSRSTTFILTISSFDKILVYIVH
jgi:hypothetical protein